MACVRSAMLFGGGDNFSVYPLALYAIPDALVKSVPGNLMTPELRQVLVRAELSACTRWNCQKQPDGVGHSPGKVTIRASYAG
jgi:hypothetical protein